jgi:NAD-dependent dihydropyrimidine dehydrogenase PreA subunit
MNQIAEHPTIKKLRESGRLADGESPARLSAAELRKLCLEAGADDAGFVEIDRPELSSEREHILRAFPRAKSLIALVCRMNRDNIRSPERGIANLEFHHTGDEVNDAARRVTARLEKEGIGAVNAAMGFPMEMDRFPGRIWTVSHKLVSEAAGLGRMGIHRNVIHPEFGNFILLGTIFIDAEIDEYSRPVDYNPCLSCMLCVAACPTGAIGADGEFNFSACYTHNYREFMGGFTDWVETVADSGGRGAYRGKVSDQETVSMWQSLSYGANYKAAYCVSVCPAGEDVIAPYLHNRKQHLDEVVRPLQHKPETVYVLPGSDAEEHVKRRFKSKHSKRVGSGLHPPTIQGFFEGLPLLFQPGQAKGLDAVYHFRFTGEEKAEGTVTIRDGKLTIESGLVGRPNLVVTTDSRTWLRFLAKEANLAWALLRMKIRLKGSPMLLVRFGRCFPA